MVSRGQAHCAARGTKIAGTRRLKTIARPIDAGAWYMKRTQQSILFVEAIKGQKRVQAVLNDSIQRKLQICRK